MSARNKPKAHYERKRRADAGVVDPHYLRACPQRKLSYPTRKIAQYKASLAWKFGQAALYCYRCPYCRLWHLTSQEQ